MIKDKHLTLHGLRMILEDVFQTEIRCSDEDLLSKKLTEFDDDGERIEIDSLDIVELEVELEKWAQRDLDGLIRKGYTVKKILDIVNS